MGLIALCPGTFDPVTNGHSDIIERAATSFGGVLVGVLVNPAKETLFPAEERVSMLKEAVGHLDGVEVASFSGLLVDFARARGVRMIVKGLRGEGDFDYEVRMGGMNRHLAGVETVFLPADPRWSFLSSSLIKEVVRFGGDVSGLVPDGVRDRLVERLAPGRD